MTTAVIQARQGLLLTTSCLLATVLLFVVIALSVSVGELSIPLQNVFYTVSNKIGLTDVPLNRIYESVIWDFRLSRALVAACCGAGLAICGAVLQSLLKNALAEPYVLGVSAEHQQVRFLWSYWVLAPVRFLSLRAHLPGHLPPLFLSPS
jgi:iron complex transport system permease protein